MRHVALAVRPVGHGEALVCRMREHVADVFGRGRPLGRRVEHHGDAVILAEREGVGFGVEAGAVFGGELFQLRRAAGDRGGGGFGADAFQLGRFQQGGGRGLMHRRSRDDRDSGGASDAACRTNRAVGPECRWRTSTSGLAAIALVSTGSMSRMPGSTPSSNTGSTAQLGEGVAQVGLSALAVGGGLVDHRRAALAQLLHHVAGMGRLGDAVAGEEAEDPGIAALGDRRRAGYRHQRNAVFVAPAAASPASGCRACWRRPPDGLLRPDARSSAVTAPSGEVPVSITSPWT